jgi:hypothetical protein
MKKLANSLHTLGSTTAVLLLPLYVSSMAVAQAPMPTPPAQATQGAAPALGTLEYGTNLFYPQGCAHNGSTVVCTFVFVHQAETATIRGGGGGSELTGIQFVDDAHVPHAPNNAYFVDRYGMRQHVLTVNRGDQGTMMVEFPLIDTRVGSGEFHLGAQVIGGIPVGQSGSAGAPGAPNTLAVGSAQSPVPGVANGQQAANDCATPQMAKTAACRFNAKINSAQTNTANSAAAIAAPVNSLTNTAKSVGGMFRGLLGNPAPAPAAPAPAQAVPQPVQKPNQSP